MINKRFLLNAILLTALVSGGAYYIYLNGSEEMDKMNQIAQEAPETDSGIGSNPESTIKNVPTGSPATVSIANFSYGPEVLRIKAGTKVVWTNNDKARHNVVADKGEFASRLLAKGESFEFTFNSKGTFSYLCEPHPWMKATVIVE